jgi:hypothetical protein
VNDPSPADFIYGAFVSSWVDDETGDHTRAVYPFQVIKRTPKFIYYMGPYERRRRIDREAFERDGSIATRHYWEHDHHLFAAFEDAEKDIAPFEVGTPDVRQLRREMADAHPDAGGSNETFIAARQRYERGRAQAERMAARVS